MGIRAWLQAAQLVGVVALSSGGCGGSAGSGANLTPEVKAACDAYFAAIQPCSLMDPSMLAATQGSWEQLCGQVFTLPGITINASNLQACASALQGVACNTEDAACRFPGGTLPGGATCVTSLQCQSENCNTESNAACGTCSPAAQAGEACGLLPTGDGGTSEETYCVSGTACAGGRCAPVVVGAAGAPCGVTAEQCASGLFCNASGGNAGVCAAPVAQGGSCSSGGACGSSLACIAGTCQARGGTGASCNQDSDCSSPLGCGSGKCGTVSWLAPGSPCDGLLNRCAQGYCPDNVGVIGTNPPAPTCPTIAGDGQACDPNGQMVQCAYGSDCVQPGDSGTTGTCVFGFASCK
jgi:hypothetical protein